MNLFRVSVAIVFALFSLSTFAAEPELVGTWKLVAFQSILNNEPPVDRFGASPKGFLILRRDGRMMTVITSGTRKFGNGDAAQAELYRSMMALSGKYRIEGSDYITTVDVSWIEAWNGSEQRRHFRIQDGKLFIESAPQPSRRFPGKTIVGRVVWERDK